MNFNRVSIYGSCTYKSALHTSPMLDDHIISQTLTLGWNSNYNVLIDYIKWHQAFTYYFKMTGDVYNNVAVNQLKSE